MSILLSASSSSATTTTTSETNSAHLPSTKGSPQHAAERALAMGCGQGPRTEQRLKGCKKTQTKTGPNPSTLGLEQWLSALELKIELYVCMVQVRSCRHAGRGGDLPYTR